MAKLRALLEILRGSLSKHFIDSKGCILNPAFGEAAALVGGADADLMIDNTLIDLKTTKKTAVQCRHLPATAGRLHFIQDRSDLWRHQAKAGHSQHSHVRVA